MDGTQQQTQALRILQIYTAYRVTLSAVLLISFLFSPIPTRLGSLDPQLFLAIDSAYLLYSLLIAVLMRARPEQLLEERPLTTLFVADILIITVITYSSGGMISGLGLLSLVTVAAGSMLIRGQPAYLLPAVATIVLLYAEVYVSLISDNPPRQYIQAGVLGALLFISSGYLQSVRQRMESSSELAQRQATNIHELEQLNYRIVQRMRTGMILTDASLRPISMNSAARELLGLSVDDDPEKLPVALLQSIEQWRQTGQRTPFRVWPGGPELRIRIDHLQPDENSQILVLIDDNSAFLQRVRQLKLASLGELTASIAHEIRNPLGSLSHAGQLLAESPGLSDDDLQLVGIMLKSSRRINRIVEDVMSLTRREDQTPETLLLQQWLPEFVEEHCNIHHPDAEINIHLPRRDRSIRFIPSQLQQVLANLIDNGLRYSQRSTGRETLTLICSDRPDMPGDGSVRLDIIDAGAGVPVEAEERLFEPFHTTEPDGTGLGLYISRQLCEANQARLIYGRSPKGESCFSLYFNPPGRDII